MLLRGRLKSRLQPTASITLQCQRDPACASHFTLSKTQVSVRGTGMAVGEPDSPWAKKSGR